MKIRYNRRNEHRLCVGVILRPGVNAVPDTNAVIAALDSVVGKALQEEKAIELLEDDEAVTAAGSKSYDGSSPNAGGSEPPASTPATDLGDLTAEEASRVIEAMTDPAALGALVDPKNRKTVADAIEKRIAELSKE